MIFLLLIKVFFCLQFHKPLKNVWELILVWSIPWLLLLQKRSRRRKYHDWKWLSVTIFCLDSNTWSERIDTRRVTKRKKNQKEKELFCQTNLSSRKIFFAFLLFFRFSHHFSLWCILAYVRFTCLHITTHSFTSVHIYLIVYYLICNLSNYLLVSKAKTP